MNWHIPIPALFPNLDALFLCRALVEAEIWQAFAEIGYDRADLELNSDDVDGMVGRMAQTIIDLRDTRKAPTPEWMVGFVTDRTGKYD